MNLDRLNNIYFIGIGGIGMSALARYFNSKGVTVAGYDKTETALTKALCDEGISIHYTDDIDLLDQNADLVIYTPAIPDNHKEFNYFKNNEFTLHKRAKVLGMITEDKTTIAVSGSHGKTTISSMITYLLKNSGVDCSAFLGGISLDYNSNYIHGDSDVFVVEADEYDRSFLTLYPSVAVVSSVDDDHLEIYGNREALQNTFKKFVMQIEKGGKLVINSNVSFVDDYDDSLRVTYGLQVKSDYSVSDFKIDNGSYVFNIDKEEWRGREIRLNIGGIHNIENAVASVAVCDLFNVDKDQLVNAISTFKGLKRRFEKILEFEDFVFFDDYAHHPRELEVLIKSLKGLYPDRKLYLIFQPHLFSRTKALAENFANSLNMADIVILMDIYPAREKPLPGVTSSIIIDYMDNDNVSLLSSEEIILLQKFDLKNSVLVTAGAGDIDKLVPVLKQNITAAYVKN